MKKILLVALALTGLVSNAQVLEQQNYDNFVLGNLGTQNGYDTLQGESANYQIANVDSNFGKSLVIIGPTKNSSQTAYYAFLKLGLESGWAARTVGNNIYKVSFDLFTGSEAGTGGGLARSVTFNKEFSSLAGISYDLATKTIKGSARVTKKADNSTVNALFNLGPETFEPNTWVNVSYSYNSVNGEVTWTYAGNTYVINNSNNPTYNVIPNSIPKEMDFVSSSTSTNTVVHNNAFDNYKAEAIGGNLAVATTAATPLAAVKIYPNPVQDVLNIVTESKISMVEIFDTAGKLIKTAKSAQVDVNSLPKGLYMLNITTNDGIFTEKMIKK
ncbi:MAG: T9SS type A sorting domain-containing protein [Soonwooa sp.]